MWAGKLADFLAGVRVPKVNCGAVIIFAVWQIRTGSYWSGKNATARGKSQACDGPLRPRQLRQDLAGSQIPDENNAAAGVTLVDICQKPAVRRHAANFKPMDTRLVKLGLEGPSTDFLGGGDVPEDEGVGIAISNGFPVVGNGHRLRTLMVA